MAYLHTTDWDQIETILLDMDGTLLDLHFDNHFWLEHVPKRYAEARGISLDEAKRLLRAQYQAIEGTLDWYCIDHWSEALGLDIAALKQEVEHLIQVHPHVRDFLARARSLGKRLVLLTNAHQKSLDLKMEKTRLAGCFDAIISAHSLGLPKEAPAFWKRLEAIEPFRREYTLFVDDSVAVLRSARRAGIRWLLAVTSPDSKQAERTHEEFRSIRDFSELLAEMPNPSNIGE